MSYLKKLFHCQCGCIEFSRELNRWFCADCGIVCSEIPQCDSTKYRGISSRQKESEKDDNFKKDS